MTKEIRDIVNAFNDAQRQGRRTALATVVHVEGSSYRRPGARMLVEDDGTLTGAISGGCLEGDALRKALQAINDGRNKLVTYNTLDDDDVQFGVQLGCNGIVHILFEPIDSNRVNNPIALLEKAVVQRRDVVLATVFSLDNYHGYQPGTCFFFDGANAYSTIDDESLLAKIKEDASAVLATKSSFLQQYKAYELTAFVELGQPPVSLIVVGAGNDALPLVAIASVLGWQITIVDGRATHANKQRFTNVDEIVVAKPAAAFQQITIDERTVFVLMTHNYNYDLEMVGYLLNKECSYIGLLGPKKRMDRLITELAQQGFVITDEHRAMIYGPTGLDIGAETAEEIALSITAEIKAVLMKRGGASLRAREDAIHSRPSSVPVLTETPS